MGRNNLQEVARRFGIEVLDAHRAMPDVITTRDDFERLVQGLWCKGIYTLRGYPAAGLARWISLLP